MLALLVTGCATPSGPPGSSDAGGSQGATRQSGDAAGNGAAGQDTAPAAASQAPAPEASASPGGSGEQGYRLGSGDGIRVHVYNTPDLSIETRISESGSVDYPLLGKVDLAGLTTAEASERIASQLESQDILRDPQVRVSVKAYRSRSVTIVGEVGEPGEYYMSQERALVDMLAKAGWTKRKGADYVVLTRRTEEGRQQYRLTLDSLTSGKHRGLQARAGDRLVVPKQEMFYIQGAVKSAGAYRLKDGMTVTEAISLGGGLTKRGSRERVVIKRRNDKGKVTTYDASLDSQLQPGDTVLVKERLF